MQEKWHTLGIAEIEQQLRTDISEGLTIREARNRLQKERIRENNKRSYLFVAHKSPAYKSIFSFLLTPSVVLLIIIALLATLFGYRVQGLSVLSMALAGSIAGGIIALRAQRMIEDTDNYASPMVRVRRGGNKFHTDGRNVVRGDVISLCQGDILVCDARIISCDELTVKELIYTPNGIRNRVVSKKVETYSQDSQINSPDAENMLYAGSAVINGEALAVAVATGSDTYLSAYVEDGAIAGKDGEADGVKHFKPTLSKICFLCWSSLIILSLLSLVTLRNTAFISNFMMLLSSIALVSNEMLTVGSRYTLASYIKRISKGEQILRDQKADSSASVCGARAISTLTKVTDLALIGDVGICDGVYHISAAFTAKGILDKLTPDTVTGNRLLTYIHAYVKAVKESGIENAFVYNGIEDSLYAHVKNCGFDISGASLIIKSLYYANDSQGENGYACVETAEREYRIALTLDSEIMEFCTHIRENGQARTLTDRDISNIDLFCKSSRAKGAECMYIVSEEKGESVIEGIVALEHHSPTYLSQVISQFKDMGVKTTVLLTDENEKNQILVSSPVLSPLFDGNIAYASEFRKKKIGILENIGNYCAYVGFSVDEYAALITSMRRMGKTVATYSIDNKFNAIIAKADISISCDIMRYSSEKYKESVYEKLAPEGRDTNVRCSQQTRLYSKVLVRRTHSNGGGLLSVLSAIKLSRGAYISWAQCILLFTMLMSSLLPIVAMSVVLGNLLLQSFQVISLAVVGAFLSLFIFSDSEQKNKLLTGNKDYIHFAADTIINKIPSIIARILTAVITSVTIKILDAIGVFGYTPSYTMAIYISLLLVLFVELFIINLEYTAKGEGRTRCWLIVLFGYAILLGVCAVSTQGLFAQEFFPAGIGTLEFLIVPAFLALYLIGVLVARFIERKRKKS